MQSKRIDFKMQIIIGANNLLLTKILGSDIIPLIYY